MVAGDAADAAALHDVGSAIADVPDRHLVEAEDADGEGGEHAPLGALLHSFIVNGEIGRIEHPPQKLAGGCAGLGGDESLARMRACESAGDLAVAMPAYAVGKNGDRSA